MKSHLMAFLRATPTSNVFFILDNDVETSKRQTALLLIFLIQCFNKQLTKEVMVIFSTKKGYHSNNITC